MAGKTREAQERDGKEPEREERESEIKPPGQRQRE